MSAFTRRFLSLGFASAILFTGGCALTPEEGAGEAREQEAGGVARRAADQPSFYGPGASRVRRNQFPPVVFGDYGWNVPEAEMAKVKAVAAFLKTSAERVILAGGAGADGPEYARQLGQQRAQAVQRALVKQGIPASMILTASYGQDLPGRGRDRVEFGFIQTDAAPVAAAGN